MQRRRFVVMGAGAVGVYLARLLSQRGHEVVVIEQDPARRREVEEQLEAAVVAGNGAHLPVLEAAQVAAAELFLAVSSSDEANMVASLLARRLGASRTVVRVHTAEAVTAYRRAYEDAFEIDLLLSTQLLTTIRILNHIRGHNTVAVEYLAGGRVQLEKFRLDEGSLLTQKPLSEVELPDDSLVVAFVRGDELVIPSGDDVARPGDDALVLAKSGVMAKVARAMSTRPDRPGTVVVAGGGDTAATLAQALSSWEIEVKLLERDRARAEELAASFPDCEVLHGDATDVAFLKSERIGSARTFVAVAGEDEQNLMASLLAQELGVGRVIALVERTESLRLWRRLGDIDVVSPRALAYEHIEQYVTSDYSADVVSYEEGAVVLERRLAAASPAAGVALAEIDAPSGFIVGAVVRGDEVFVPRGKDELEVGDTVILFVRSDALDTVRLFFPGRDE